MFEFSPPGMLWNCKRYPYRGPPNVWCFEFSCLTADSRFGKPTLPELPIVPIASILHSLHVFSSVSFSKWNLLLVSSFANTDNHCRLTVQLFTLKQNSQFHKEQITEPCLKVLHLFCASKWQDRYLNLPTFSYVQIYSSHHKVMKDESTNWRDSFKLQTVSLWMLNVPDAFTLPPFSHTPR